MTHRDRAVLTALTAALLSTPRPATAQTVQFPPEEDWVPFRCEDQVMTDAVDDEPGAVDERDVVGDLDAPAALHAADDDFLYLRIRLDADPTTGDGVTLAPPSWGVEFDLDGDRTNYELLILADGAIGEISLFENTGITLDNDPADPADEPPATFYLFEDAGRSLALPSGFGGDADAFLDLAVLWQDLAPLGLEPDTPISVWVASSTSANSLDGDFACHDGQGGADAALEGTASDETFADPDLAGGDGGTGDGGDGADDGGADSGPQLEGGGGCTAAPPAGARGTNAGALPLILVILGLLVWRLARERLV